MPWYEMTESELQTHMKIYGLPKFRGTQLFEGVHRQGKNLAEIQNIPKILKDLLKNQKAPQVIVEKVYKSKIDPTKKILYKLYDGQIIEGVLMEYKHGKSLCVSTQVGCRMGCRFCASTANGKVRNLTPYEMLSQVYVCEKHFKTKISNVILMGSGEPLDNYDNVLRFLSLLHEEKGKRMSYRNMTISTCGLVPEIIKLSEEEIPVNLAVSLHQTVQEKRQSLMPVAKIYNLQELFDSLRSYQKSKSQRITLEYTLIEGENDLEENIKGLKTLTRGMNVLVNLISLNPTDKFSAKGPKKKAIYAFCDRLKENGINATVRRELGADIQASCGQLKAGYENGIKGVVE